MKSITKNLVPSHVEAENINDYIGRIICLHGIVHKIREMSGFAFVIIRTKRRLLQCVYSADFSAFELALLKENMSVVIRGEVVKEERSKAGSEIRLISFECLCEPSFDMPVVINGRDVSAAMDTLLDYRPITLRNAKQRGIFTLQAGLCRGMRNFFDKNRFMEIHSPKIVFSGAEGGANAFRLDYFGKEAYLAQSPQFYKQMMVGVFERVYEIAPVFRAEKHDTSRHINEYTSVDMEMGFIESFEELMTVETKMLDEAFAFLQEYYEEEIDLLKAEIPVIKEIPAIKFFDAKELIAKTYKRKSFDDEDFEPEEERLLCEIIKKESGSDFVFVTHYKSSKRPFYAMDTPGNPTVTESFDLLFRGMEITTGGQRIHDYKEQTAKMTAMGMDPCGFESYLMAHKHGLPPHGGFGLGLERLTARLLGFPNVRSATLFPRDINRLEP